MPKATRNSLRSGKLSIRNEAEFEILMRIVMYATVLTHAIYRTLVGI